MAKKKDQKIFSVSEEFKQVHDILGNVPNMSRYICQAVIEKHKRELNGDISIPFELKEFVRAKLETMLNKGTIIFHNDCIILKDDNQIEKGEIVDGENE